jgi:hypothetical protein
MQQILKRCSSSETVGLAIAAPRSTDVLVVACEPRLTPDEILDVLSAYDTLDFARAEPVYAGASLGAADDPAAPPEDGESLAALLDRLGRIVAG